MSVTGEFRRLVSDCIAFLDGSTAAGAEQRADALRAAVALAANDLTEAAQRMLALAEGGRRHTAIEFASPAEQDEFEQLWGHALAITRVILGGPEA